MKQIWITRYGPPEVLKLRETPDPEPQADEVRVVVRAAGVNFADLMARMGIYPDGPPAPCVVGYEVSGVIDKIGAGVSRDFLGRRVVAMTRFGGYSSQVTLPSSQCVEIPSSISFEDAASVPVAGLTSWMILNEMHRVRRGDRILVHSAGGSVGLIAVQLIKLSGGYAVGTASSSKHEWLEQWGYDHLIDYHVDDYEAVLRKEPKFDLVMDPLGGHHWQKALRLIRPGGKIACYGMSVNAEGTIRRPFQFAKNLLRVPFWSLGPLGLINENKGVLGINMGRLWDERTRLTAWVQQLFRLMASEKLKPKIHARVPFEEASQAHQILHRRENIGKVLLIP